MHRVLLFDIDGTLLSTGGAGQRAMELALTAAFGVETPNEDIPFAGRTDHSITTELFRKHGVPEEADMRLRFISRYFEHLPLTLQGNTGRVLPGVNDLLTNLSERMHVKLGLLTGNFREGARLKLAHFALDHHFRFGGYGDDYPDRDDVARAAFASALEHVGNHVKPDETWVIGDTPNDVKCGRAIGARVLAVATGIYKAEELAACEPDVLLEDLSDLNETLAALGV